MATFVPRAVDDSGFVIGTDLVSPMGALCDETSPDSVDEGDAGLVRMTADRKLLTRVVGSTDSSRLEVDSSGRITVVNSFLESIEGETNIIAAAVHREDQASDTASGSPDYGMGVHAIRKATPANTSNADGDYEFLQMSAGRLWTSAKLEANSGVDIGDVDVTTVGTITPGTAATNLGKAEDGAHTSGDVGVMALAVALDSQAGASPTTLISDQGDYAPLIVNQYGKLITAYTYKEDQTHQSQEHGAFIMGVRNDSAGDLTNNSGDYSPIATHSSGAVAIAGLDSDDTGELQTLALTQTGSLIIGRVDVPISINGAVELAGVLYNEIFTGTGNGASQDANGSSYKYHSLQVDNAGSVTVWDVRVEGSNDAANWTQIVQHTNVDLSGTTEQATGAYVFGFIRTRVAGYTGSGNLVAFRMSTH